MWLFALRASALWLTGYYPSYVSMPVTAVDFSNVTHVIHFCLLAGANGSITNNGLGGSASTSFVKTVHGAGRQAIVCVGGAGSQAGFEGATTSANVTNFVASLTNFAGTYGYDGVDIDWEPLSSSDVHQYTNFVQTLRAALNHLGSGKLLTVAAPAYTQAAMYASIQSQFDQINIMTYDLSGPYEGWVTWFNSPLQDGGYTFPSTHGLVPSVNGAVNNFTSAGIAPGKLGIGLPFYGYVWTGGPGVTAPRQGWTTPVPTVSEPTYQSIIKNYYQPARYHWDDAAQAPYLSITNTTAANDMFISYDDAAACEVKVSYARNHGLGGIMIWELSQDYSASSSPTHPLLHALDQSLATPRILSAALQGGNLVLSFSTLPLASYRVAWTTDLAAGNWNTLSNNIPGDGSPVTISDPAGLGSAARFYRVQTPP
jgi:chitinase